MKVTPIGRLQWYVQSESRPNVTHLVDFECDLDPGEPPMICSCEAWHLLVMRPCKHVLACIDWLVDNARLTARERDTLRAELEIIGHIGARTERSLEKPSTSSKPKWEKTLE